MDAGTPTNNTINAADRLDGGAGEDIFEITVEDINGNVNLASLQTSNIEKISVRNVDPRPRVHLSSTRLTLMEQTSLLRTGQQVALLSTTLVPLI